MARTSERFVIRCSTCDSEDVVRDAWASWDYRRQEWVMDQTFDYTYCQTCEAECSIKQVPAETSQDKLKAQ